MVRLNNELALVDREVAARLSSEQLEVLEKSISELKSNDVARRALSVGEKAPDFELRDGNGDIVRSADLRARGPLVLSFFQGSWSPYCMVNLKAIQGLLPEIRACGAAFIAISPEAPEFTRKIPEGLRFDFPILADEGNRVAREFKLVYTLSPAARPIYAHFGVDVSERNADHSWDIPVPATYMIGTDATIVSAFLDADFRRRIAPDELLDWVELSGFRAL